ncbi:hypothetical protein FGRMN_10009 [Fusarium graminum]|nr:hypothetical protein FGRMN_10009 [Fusarium graminum]
MATIKPEGRNSRPRTIPNGVTWDGQPVDAPIKIDDDSDNEPDPLLPTINNGARPRARRGTYGPLNATSQPDPSDRVIQSLNQQVTELQNHLQQLRNEPRNVQPNAATSRRRPPPLRLAPEKRAPAPPQAADIVPRPPPSSGCYIFNPELARRHLRMRGGSSVDPEVLDEEKLISALLNGSCDPFWILDLKGASQICSQYDSEIGRSYPFLPFPNIFDNMNALFNAVQTGAKAGFAFSSLPGPDHLDPDDVDILRLAFSTTLLITGDRNTQIATALLAGAQKNISKKLLEPPSLKKIVFFTLMAFNSFHSGEERQAWRFIGIAARSCLEMGLHQATTYDTMFQDPIERERAIDLFWCIHTLDRKLSLSAGLPCLMQGNEMDPNMPVPGNEHQFLKAIVTYDLISEKARVTLSKAGGIAFGASADDIDNLYNSIERWYRNVPAEVKLVGPEKPQQGRVREKVLTYLAACQTRILLHMSTLHITPPEICSPTIQAMIGIAKDMILRLQQLSQNTRSYVAHQPSFNPFLVSSICTILLAVALEPATFGNAVRTSYTLALGLLYGHSKKGYVSRKLWRMVWGMQKAGILQNVSGEMHNVQRPWLANPQDGMDMGHLLGELFVALENDVGLWGFGLGETGTFQQRGIIPKLDFSQMIDSFV